MKKVVSVMLVMVMVLALATVVNAATPNEDMRDFLAAGVTVAGEKYTLSDDELVQVDRYLEEHELTADQVADVKSEINATVEYINNTGVSNVSELTKEQRATVIRKANNAAAVVDLYVDYEPGKTLSVVDYDGNVVFEKATDDFKRTGGQEVMPIVILSTLAIIAVAGVVYAKRNNK